MDRVTTWVKRHEAILVILILVVFLRLPSLFEPYWYGDEGIYLTIGRAIRSGVPLYQGIHDNKPPLLYLVAAAAGGNQFWFKFIAGVGNVATVAVFWRLATRWNRRVAAVITTIFALLTTLPLLEGNIANAELFFLLPTVAAFGTVFAHPQEGRKLWLAGGLWGLAALFKAPAGLEAGVWPLVWLMSAASGIFKKGLILAAAAAVPIGISVVYFASQGSLPQYLTAALGQNLPYLSSWQAAGGSGVGAFANRAWLLVILLAIIWRASPKLGREATVVAVWWLVTLFAALLSGRPYPHYLLQMAAPLALGAGLLVYGERPQKKLIIGLIALLVAAAATFKFYVYPVGAYYQNFARWIMGRQSLEEYFAYFGSSVNRNYAIAKAVMAGTLPHERVFVWGDEPMIYALARRLPAGKYTVKYHVQDFAAQAETIDRLQQTLPRYLVSFGHEEQLAGLSDLTLDKYVLEQEIEGVKVYRLLNHRLKKGYN